MNRRKHDKVAAAYTRSGPRIESPPAGGAAEGQCIPVVGCAAPIYASDLETGKPFPQSSVKQSSVPSLKPDSSKLSRKYQGVAQVAFRASDGRIWRYRGKRARVLVLLVDGLEGVTQWDTLPWHTRLGGTIHAMRRDGLDISTELEGDYRHARYRLHTPGSLLIQAENRERGDD